jgi:predicted XRE-type DNA-binding protein
MELQKSQLESKKGQVELEANLMKNARNTLAPINDQGTYDLWRQKTISQLPGVAPFLPAKFDDKVKTSLMLEADKYIAQTQLSTNQAAQLGLTKRGQDLTYSAATQPVFSESAGGFFTRPTGGKEATFVEPTGMENTKKGKEKQTGKELVSDVATQMGNSYLTLQQTGGIKSTQKGAAANIAAASQSSMLGQLGGAALGTPEQAERDFIKSQRPLLVQAIVKATGMSATQINSNVELKNLLDAATDPSKGYETNAKSLNLINKRFGTGAEVIPVNTGGGSNIDALLEKYK